MKIVPSTYEIKNAVLFLKHYRYSDQKSLETSFDLFRFFYSASNTHFFVFWNKFIILIFCREK